MVMKFLLLLLLFHCVDTKTVVYISLEGDELIALYNLQPDGSLDLLESYDTLGGVGPLAVNPSRTHLYASVRSTQELKSYRVNPSTGQLSLVNTIPDVDNSNYISVDSSGQFLFSSYNRAGQVAVWDIRAGAVQAGSAIVTPTTRCAHMFLQDAKTQQYAFVPHTCSNAIYQFAFQNGNLVANTQEPVLDAGEETALFFFSRQPQPRHIVMHASIPYVYSSNEADNSVTRYKLDESTGQLEKMDTVTTLPFTWLLLDRLGKNTASQIHLTPDQRFLYVSNRGHNSIAGFAVNDKDGSLLSIGHFGTEAVPRAFGITPDGQFLLVAGEDSGRAASYRIDGRTGMLTQLSVVPVGQAPKWVEIVHLPGGGDPVMVNLEPSGR